MGKNPLDDFKPQIEQKESSFSKTGSESSKFPHEKYRTIRIKPSDHELLRDIAHEQRMTMVDAISVAIDMLNKHLQAQAKEDK